MISPTNKPWTLTSASHSGQCVIAYFSSFTNFYFFCYDNSGTKKALHPLERTKSECALVVPPSFAHAFRFNRPSAKTQPSDTGLNYRTSKKSMMFPVPAH